MPGGEIDDNASDARRSSIPSSSTHARGTAGGSPESSGPYSTRKIGITGDPAAHRYPALVRGSFDTVGVVVPRVARGHPPTMVAAPPTLPDHPCAPPQAFSPIPWSSLRNRTVSPCKIVVPSSKARLARSPPDRRNPPRLGPSGPRRMGMSPVKIHRADGIRIVMDVGGVQSRFVFCRARPSWLGSISRTPVRAEL